MKIKILSLLVIGPFCFSQNLIQTDIQGKKIKDFIQLENRLGSKLFETDEEYVSVKPVLKPVIFERKEQEIPNLLVFYSGYRKDSAIAEILYEWDVYNFDKGENVKKPLRFNKAMIKKYQELISEVSKKHGKSIHKGSLNDLNLLHSDGGLHRSDEWKINDHLNISAYINLSEHYERQGIMATTPTHRIRLSVTNERENQAETAPALSPEKISLYNTLFLEFLEKLKISDFAGARMRLAERIRPSATDDALKILAENIRFDRETEIFMTGLQVIPDGNQYPMIKFKYADDGLPPKETITVFFDEDEKILGINPMKQMN